MNSKGKILLPVLIVLAVISLFLAAGAFYLYQKEYAQNVKLQGQITELENRQRLTVNQLEEAKKKATELSLKLEEAKNRLDSLTGELAVEKSAHAETSGKLEQSKQDLAKQKTLREDLENRLNQVQGDSKQIKEELKVIQQQKSALEEKIKNLEGGSGGVELGKVVVSPEAVQPAGGLTGEQAKTAAGKNSAPDKNALKPAGKTQPSSVDTSEGKVMIVNKEFNFVVINLGSKDKVALGDEFIVSRAGKTIGEIKVEKVHEFMSAAGFATELKDLIKENDKVVKKIK